LITVSPLLQRLDGELVADRDVALRLDQHVLVLVHDPAVQLLAGLHAFHDHHPHGVVLVVHHEMNHRLQS
jgi:hypothetical protein